MKLFVFQTSLPASGRYRNSKGFHQIGHVQYMISEVIHESDGLKNCFLNRGLGKVKDLQALLWSECGSCRGDEVTNVFDLL